MSCPALKTFSFTKYGLKKNSRILEKTVAMTQNDLLGSSLDWFKSRSKYSEPNSETENGNALVSACGNNNSGTIPELFFFFNSRFIFGSSMLIEPTLFPHYTGNKDTFFTKYMFCLLKEAKKKGKPYTTSEIYTIIPVL